MGETSKKFRPSTTTSVIMTKLILAGADIQTVVGLVASAAKDGADLFAETLQDRIKQLDAPTIDN